MLRQSRSGLYQHSHCYPADSCVFVPEFREQISAVHFLSESCEKTNWCSVPMVWQLTDNSLPISSNVEYYLTRNSPCNLHCTVFIIIFLFDTKISNKKHNGIKYTWRCIVCLSAQRMGRKNASTSHRIKVRDVKGGRDNGVTMICDIMLSRDDHCTTCLGKSLSQWWPANACH